MKWITRCCLEATLTTTRRQLWEKKRLRIVYMNLKRILLKFFWNDDSSWGRKTHCKVSFHCMTVLLRLRCYVTFVNNVICAYYEQLQSLSLFEYLSFVTPSVPSSEDQEIGKRISLNSRNCPCEGLTQRKSRYRQNSNVIHSVTLTWTSIIRCWLTVFPSRKCV